MTNGMRQPQALDLVVGEEHLLEHQQDQQRGELPADQRHVLKARIEAAVALVGHLGQIGRAGPIFPAEAQALQDAGNAEQDRRPQCRSIV